MFERCDEPGGIHETLLPFAAIALLVYVLGYPTVLGTLLYRNRMVVMEDQLIRATGKGTTRLENPHAYVRCLNSARRGISHLSQEGLHVLLRRSPSQDFRKRYHRLYYHFRPDRYYWILLIVGRKAGIAFTALMFNKNAAFQLSVALLVMFIAYALQVCPPPRFTTLAYAVHKHAPAAWRMASWTRHPCHPPHRFASNRSCPCPSERRCFGSTNAWLRSRARCTRAWRPASCKCGAVRDALRISAWCGTRTGSTPPRLARLWPTTSGATTRCVMLSAVCHACLGCADTVGC